MREEILRLVEENKDLIYKIASKYSYYYEIEDLFQVGVIGLINAYRKYNARSPTKFSTFAYTYIFGEIIKYIKNDRNIRLSSDYFKIYKLYINAKDSLAQTLGRTPSLKEISEFMEIEEQLLANIISSSEFTLSLEASLGEETSLENLTGYDEREEVDNKVIINESISSLEETERKIIDLRYYKDYSQSETAKILGMSQAQVSRKENFALKMIKRDIAA